MNRRSFFSFLAVAPIAGFLPLSEPPKKSFKETMRRFIDGILSDDIRQTVKWRDYVEKHQWIKPHIPFKEFRVDLEIE